MSDQTMSIGDLKEMVAEFVRERNWEPYHRPKNLAGSICIEAAELLEVLQWEDIETQDARSNKHLMARINDETADILIYIISLANSLGMDLSGAVANKLGKNRDKYPL